MNERTNERMNEQMSIDKTKYRLNSIFLESFWGYNSLHRIKKFKRILNFKVLDRMTKMMSFFVISSHFSVFDPAAKVLKRTRSASRNPQNCRSSRLIPRPFSYGKYPGLAGFADRYNFGFHSAPICGDNLIALVPIRTMRGYLVAKTIHLLGSQLRA